MNEIEVILDIRQVPGSLDLVVVRQTLSAEGGTLHLVGNPSEGKISLSLRKAAVTLSMKAEREAGLFLVAHVKNVGFTLLDEIRVDFEYQFMKPEDASAQFPTSPPAKQMGEGFGFNPASKKYIGPMVPGETRDWYLPADFFDAAAKTALKLPPDRYWINVKSGPDEVARIPGEEVAPWLRIPSAGRRVKMDRRVKESLESLSSRDREAVRVVLDNLEKHDLDQLPGAKQLPGDKSVYFMTIPPELFLLLQKVEGTSKVEVVDVVRSDILQALIESRKELDVQG